MPPSPYNRPEKLNGIDRDVIGEIARIWELVKRATMRDLHEARMFFEPAIVRSLSGDRLTSALAELRSCIDDIQ